MEISVFLARQRNLLSCNSMVPSVGISRKLMHLRKVLFPEPDAPIIDTTSPSRAVSETPSEPRAFQIFVKIVNPDGDRTVRHLSCDCSQALLPGSVGAEPDCFSYCSKKYAACNSPLHQVVSGWRAG